MGQPTASDVHTPGVSGTSGFKCSQCETPMRDWIRGSRCHKCRAGDLVKHSGPWTEEYQPGPHTGSHAPGFTPKNPKKGGDGGGKTESKAEPEGSGSDSLLYGQKVEGYADKTELASMRGLSGMDQVRWLDEDDLPDAIGSTVTEADVDAFITATSGAGINGDHLAAIDRAISTPAGQYLAGVVQVNWIQVEDFDGGNSGEGVAAAMGLADGESTNADKVLATALKRAPKTEIPLYRGVNDPGDGRSIRELYAVGTTHNFSAVSTSAAYQVATTFAEQWGTDSVVLRFPPGSKALDVEAFNPWQAEHIATGEYGVSNIETLDDGRTVIHMEPV